MKKNALVQLIIIYTGIGAIYLAAYSLIQIVYLYISGSSAGFGRSGLEMVIPLIVLALFGVVIIGKSCSISTFISERSGLDDSLTIYTKPNQLLSILIVVTALSHLLDHLPAAITRFIDIFTAPSYITDDGQSRITDGWWPVILRITIPCLVIIFSKSLTNYFSKNIMQDNDEIIAHHDTVEIAGPENMQPGEDEQA